MKGFPGTNKHCARKLTLLYGRHGRMRRKSEDRIVKYQEALEYIESLRQYKSVSNLKNMERLCEYLGNPQNKLKCVYIDGTVGKGSTLAFISAVLKSAGYCVGSFASQAVFDFCERIQVSGRPITQKMVAEGTFREDLFYRLL